MQYDFSLDGVSAAAKGIILQKPPVISPVVAEYKDFTVPQYGVYHTFEGYANRTVTFTAFILSTDFDTDLRTAISFLNAVDTNGFPTVRKIRISGLDGYYKGLLKNALEINPRYGANNTVIAPFEAVYDIEPYRYITDNSKVLV